MNLDAALGVLVTQIGGSKRKTLPISRIAEAADVAIRRLGSAQRVADRMNRPTARSQINDFVAINRLPQDIKRDYVDKRLIGIEAASELSRIDNMVRIREVAKVIIRVQARDAMKIIDYAKRNPNLSAVKCKQRILGSKDKRRQVDVIVIPFEEEEYAKLLRLARSRGTTPHSLAREIVTDWMKSQ